MPIRKHGRGYEVRVQHGGRRYTRTVATRSDALYLEGTWRRRFNDSRAGRVPSYALEEALERWAREEFPRLKAKTSARAIVKATRPFFDGMSIEQAPAVADKIKEAGLARGLRAEPINRQMAFVKRLAKLAYRNWGWLENDVGSKIRLMPGETKRSEWVTPAEAKRLMCASKGQIREAIRWACLTGLRRGEILAIEPHHFRDGAVYLPDSKSGKPRMVPLPPELSPKHFPFGLHPTYLSRGFQNARRLARMAHIRFHDLRRSYGTWLVHGGADLASVRDLLGHSTVAMTSRYLGSSVKQLRKAIRGLPSFAAQKRGRKAVSHSRG